MELNFARTDLTALFSELVRLEVELWGVGGVSKIVDRLEAAGYCARRVNPADRRSSIIELTAPGDRLLIQLSQTGGRAGAAAGPGHARPLAARPHPHPD